MIRPKDKTVQSPSRSHFSMNMFEALKESNNEDLRAMFAGAAEKGKNKCMGGIFPIPVGDGI